MGRIYFENETTHEKIAMQPLQWDNPPYQYMNQQTITVDGEIYYYYRGVMSASGVLPALSQDLWSNAMTPGSAWWKSKRMRFPVSISVNPTFSQVGITGAKFDSQDLNANITATSFYNEGQLVPCAILPYYTTYGGNDGILLIGRYHADTYDVSYSECCFIPMALWDFADVVNPYDPSGQEYPGGTPDGGYGSGTANKGDATAGTVPTHPIVSGRGVHYMLVNDAQLADFSDHMWGRGTGVFETLWQKWENYKFNPMAGVLTCHALPTAFYPTVAGAASSISIAGTSVPVSCTAVSIGIVEQVYTESLADILQYGSFLDFDYLKIYAHIPFCGICEIPPSSCIGGSVKFIYRCDILTGNVACWVCTTDRFGATHQINCLTGNCAYIVPITGNDNGMSAIIGALSSNLTAMVGSFEKGAQAFATGGSPGAGGVSAAGSTANALRMVTAQKHTTVAGNVSGSVAILSNMHLFLDITYANPSYPSTMLDVRGTPSDRGGSVGTFADTYTEFSDIHADGISGATEEEKRMIETALKQGVYV